MRIFTVDEILAVMEKKGHLVFRNDNVNYNLNLIGVRASNPVFNDFNDMLYVLWRYKNQWNMEQFVVTTLPGKYYEEQPMNVDGCAILVPGQYRDMWRVGMHFDQEALIQFDDCSVYRDNNKDDVFNFDPATIQKGNFRIDCHRKNFMGVSQTVDQGSAGCMVFQDGSKFETVFMPMVKACPFTTFTFTLLLESDFS